jgi:hypothetical protein
MNLGKWKKVFCPKIGINNEVICSDESSMPLDYARHSCMYSKTLILEKKFLKLD